MSKKNDALDELYICSTELGMFLLDRPKRMSAAKTKEMEKLLAACQEAREEALDLGASKAEVREMLDMAEESAGMLDEMAASGMKITVEL
jgi:hypothetical protein